jgi:exosortase E/protease (VPEID-CTERM system)
MHLLSYGVFFALTAVLFGQAQAGEIGLAQAGVWYLSCAGVLLSWLAAALPVSNWRPLLRRTAGLLLAGVAIGVLGWAGGYLADLLWQPLGITTLILVRSILRLIVPEVVSDASEFLIGTPSFRVTIAPACSGYEGVGLVVVFLAVYLWWNRRELRFPQAFLLVPIGALAIWLANSLRIAGLILLGTYGSPEVALGGFHSQAGWLAFIAVSLGLMLVAQRIPLFTHVAGERDEPGEAAPYLMPLLALVGTMMVAQAVAEDPWTLYPLRVVVVGLVLWLYRRRYQEVRLTWSWTAAGIGVLVFVLWMVFEKLLPTAATDEVPGVLAGGMTGFGFAWLVSRVVGSVVLVPVAEELAFRGYLMRRLVSSDTRQVPIGQFTWLSFVVSSLLFGVLHGRWLAGTVAGGCYAYALYRRRELADPIVAHAVTNGLIALYVLTTGSWSLWS